MMKTFTVVVHEAEEGGYWGECLELECGSQGESLDEIDRNIRESIQAVLCVRLEDGENLAELKRFSGDVALRPTDRRWEIAVELPDAVAA